ncbi:hypothetical protein PILCRDRAFT_812079 [Piloderma croceum F 1598]|uniref:RING-type domain-containing protein n=1 Tax=Piloderma croceum (strain F 1598) TaxID=765440 RepID=A0A0C3BUW2_PILCF|nr:hypothetical protein PILCRDRAFT_812079 [Piloderma croceum F 1598]
MADVTCTICLEQLKMPVVIPCGHVHCEKCLTAHIQSGKDAIHSQCPTCRTTFNIVTPDWRYVPKKYHEFMIPSVRKVFIEIPSQAGFKNQIALLESRVKSLEKDKELLLTKCESSMAASVTHAEGEKKARLDAEKTKKEMVQLKRNYDTFKGKYYDLKKSRESGDQSFNSKSSSSLHVEGNSFDSHDADDVPISSRIRRPLPSRANRISLPSHVDMDESMPLDPPRPIRKRLRKSASESLENRAGATLDRVQLPSNEDPADNERPRVPSDF